MPKIKKLKAPPQKIEFLSQREADLLLENSSGIGHLLILTALKTGLRLGELIGLSWTDVNFSNKTLTVSRSWCRYKKELVSPKSNKERTVPLTDTLHDALFEVRRVEGPVFINERSRRISGRTIRLEIRRACERSGIRVVACHKLRHTFASHLAMAGAPIPSIQQLMGHSDIKTTMLYAHLSESTLRSAVGLLDGVVKSPFMDYVNRASTATDEQPTQV